VIQHHSDVSDRTPPVWWNLS